MKDDLDMRRFDAVFEKYADGKEYLDWRALYRVWKGQRCANDWFGWVAGGLECKSNETRLTQDLADTFCEGIALYILLWPDDGRMKKGEILGVFDGSTFEKIARRRAGQL